MLINKRVSVIGYPEPDNLGENNIHMRDGWYSDHDSIFRQMGNPRYLRWSRIDWVAFTSWNPLKLFGSLVYRDVQKVNITTEPNVKWRIFIRGGGHSFYKHFNTYAEADAYYESHKATGEYHAKD